jgi:hypothetical protein
LAALWSFWLRVDAHSHFDGEQKIQAKLVLMSLHALLIFEWISILYSSLQKSKLMGKQSPRSGQLWQLTVPRAGN